MPLPGRVIRAAAAAAAVLVHQWAVGLQRDAGACEQPADAQSESREPSSWAATTGVDTRLVVVLRRSRIGDMSLASHSQGTVVVALGNDGPDTAEPGEIRPTLEREAYLSALFTSGGPSVYSFRIPQRANGARRLDDIVGLVAQQGDRDPRLLALIVPRELKNGSPALDLYYRHGGDRGQAADTAFLKMTGLEHLYDLVAHQTARNRFSILPLSHAPTPAEAEPERVSKAQALAEIARMRECAANELLRERRDVQLRRWRNVFVENAQPHNGEGDRLDVSVRVSSAGKPLTGATVGFERAPELICIARVDAQGYARCRLFDPHPHPGHEDDAAESEAPVDVTISGMVGPEFIDLPTTVILSSDGVVDNPISSK